MNYNDSEAKRWSTETLISIISDPSTKDELDKQWNDFCGQPIDKQMDSNNKSIELYGKTNQDRYYELLSKYDKQDIDDNDHYSSMYRENNEMSDDRVVKKPVETDVYIIGDHSYKKIKVIEAKQWMEETLYQLIYFTTNEDELEEMWYKFNNQTIKIQLRCDSKAIELFGMDNKTQYEAIKSFFLKKDIDQDTEKVLSDNTTESENECYSLIRGNGQLTYDEGIKFIHNYQSMTESVGIKRMAEAALLKHTYHSMINRTHKIEYASFISDLPYFTISEINDFYIENTEDDHYNEFRKKWLESYDAFCHGVFHPELTNVTKEWITEVRRISSEPKSLDRDNRLVGLGWLPLLAFNPADRKLASSRVKSKIESSYRQMMDMTPFMEFVSENEEEHHSILNEVSGTDDVLLPVFIVLVAGTAVFSKVIKAYTHSNYSHSAISLDSNLDKLYSYNAKNPEGKDGFSIESIQWYQPDQEIEVYTIFVNKKDLETMDKNIKYFIGNQDKSHYSMATIFTMPFSMINPNFDLSMICSQFVDRILKLTDIDLTNKNSAKVRPSDFEKVVGNNGRIYKVYEGKCKDYNKKKVNNFINILKRKAVYIKESSTILSYLTECCHNLNTMKKLSITNIEESDQKDMVVDIYERCIAPYLTVYPVTEVKEFPIEFSKEGDLLIKNIKSIDYDKEYFDSHRLLQLYEKDKNIEGTKYEISKLWFLNNLLEKKLKNRSLSDEERNSYNISRARILNDFNRYIRIVMKEDKEFNFKTYYNNTPFCDETIKITGSTLKYTIDGIKRIIGL